MGVLGCELADSTLQVRNLTLELSGLFLVLILSVLPFLVVLLDGLIPQLNRLMFAFGDERREGLLQALDGCLVLGRRNPRRAPRGPGSDNGTFIPPLFS